MGVRAVRALAVVVILLGASTYAAASVERSLCVFDPVGATGDVFQMMKDYQLAAQRWGVRFELRQYTNEDTAVGDFRAGQCDAVAITGIRNRGLVKFAGSLDMMAALPSYEAQRTAIAAMSAPKAAPYMREGAYETVGVVPLGMVFMFGRDRTNLDDWKQLAGQKVATFAFDQQQVEMVQYAGGSVVPASIATFAPMFNNGSVDLAYAPAVAYLALELYKGLGDAGGILRYNLAIASGQLTVHWERFPEDFGVKSRQWVFQNIYERAMRLIRQAESEIPERYWVELDPERASAYTEMFQEVRQRLWEREVYSRKMQHMLKKIRCREQPGSADCSKDTEGGPVN